MIAKPATDAQRIALLARSQRRGSRPRCLLLTHGADEAVASRLNAIVAPAAQIVVGTHKWAPRGFAEPDELELDKAADFLPPDHRQELRAWWLAKSTNFSKLPTWDLVASATIEGRQGLVLVEAKAHEAELELKGKPSSSPVNDANIGRRIGEASAALNSRTPGWSLTAASHYQLANRFAWAWKIASFGIPVVLVYLGFERADEMIDRGTPIANAIDWDQMVAAYGAGVVPERAWREPVDIGGTPFIALRRSVRVDLPTA